MAQRRVVVTGVGLLSSVGNGTEENWSAVRKGESGIAPITQFDAAAYTTRIAGEVKHFDPLAYVEKKELKKMGRFIQFAIAASEFAVKSAQLKVTEEDAESVGVYIGSGIGAFEVIEREHKILLERGPSRLSPFFIPSCIVNLASGYVSIRYNAKGPNSATATACTTSAHSIGDSFRLIQHGDADVMICGGSEACITPMGVGGSTAHRRAILPRRAAEQDRPLIKDPKAADDRGEDTESRVKERPRHQQGTRLDVLVLKNKRSGIDHEWESEVSRIRHVHKVAKGGDVPGIGSGKKKEGQRQPGYISSAGHNHRKTINGKSKKDVLRNRKIKFIASGGTLQYLNRSPGSQFCIDAPAEWLQFVTHISFLKISGFFLGEA